MTHPSHSGPMESRLVDPALSLSLCALADNTKAQRGDLHSFHHHKVITVDGVGRGDQSVKMAVVPEYWCSTQTV